MVKHTQNNLSVFEHFVKLVLVGLACSVRWFIGVFFRCSGIAAQNSRCVFLYFCDRRKNDFRLKFRSSFNASILI